MGELVRLGIETYELDVADPQSIQKLKAQLEPVLGGKLDILVNNACVASFFSRSIESNCPSFARIVVFVSRNNSLRELEGFLKSNPGYNDALLDIPLDQIRSVFDVNVIGEVLLLNYYLLRV